MFGESLLGAASSVGARASPVSGATRSSELSARTREDGGAAFSQKASEAAGGLAQSRADPVVVKDRAAQSRQGKRRRTDASDDERPGPRVKFKVPDGDGSIGPIFEEEGREAVEVGGDRVEATSEPGVARRSDADPDEKLGRFLDLYA